MSAATEKLFLPGFAALSSLYRPGLPANWTAIDPPGFGGSDGSFAGGCRWLVGELDRRNEPVELAGHSMGAALAIAAAAARPASVARLVLIAPAGLPLDKPFARSLGEFVSQVARGWYPLAEARRSIRDIVRSPRRALGLARALHRSDLSAEMEAVRAGSIDTVVVSASSDTLVTTEHCRRAAQLLGARYRELSLDGGHMWMLGSWAVLAGLLENPS